MRILFVLFLILPIFLGCAEIRQFALDTSQSALEDAEVERQIADNLMTRWSLDSGLVTCGAADDVQAVTLKDIKKLDKLVKDNKKWSNEDYNRGCFLGIQLRMTAKEIQKYVEKIISLAVKYGAM